MNGDIRPPRRPTTAQPESEERRMDVLPLVGDGDAPVDLIAAPTNTETEESPAPSDKPASKRSKRKIVLWSLIGLLFAIFLLAAGAAVWYFQALTPVDRNNESHVRLSVKSGSGPTQIGQVLYDKGLIRSTLAFDLYTRINGVRNQLQAGAYSLSPSESTPEIIGHLTSGRTDMISITFYPGATLRDTTDTPEDKKTDVTSVLLRAGYTKQEIEAALSKSYAARGVASDALFEGKPAEAGLEGYVYGETYAFSSDATVEDILSHVFDVYYEKILAQNIIEPLKQRGFTLYQGIILASIVQREVSAANANEASEDQRQVAQVFYNRLAMNMPLGSDVTAYYGADQIGESRTVEVDTPYNTRKYPGLTPGPIAVPSVGALAAVANPADNDYIYFLSGDDDVTYFGRTDEEHQANIKNYCHVKCAIP